MFQPHGDPYQSEEDICKHAVEMGIRAAKDDGEGVT